MSDLISRKELLKIILNDTKNTYTLGDIGEIIGNCPVRYDVDKVVKKLEKRIEDAERVIVKTPHDKLDQITNDAAEAFIAAYKDSIEIVKGGRTDE